MLYIAPACIAGTNSIDPTRLRNLSARPLTEIDNYFGLCVKPMHVTRLMIFRIGNKSNPIEPN